MCASLKVLLVIVCSAALTSGADKEICLLPPDEGPCRARIPSYYYDRYTQSCRQFIYGGCEGNANNFETWAACDEACTENTDDSRRHLEEEYEVESIVSHTVIDGVVVYSVSWVGYPGEITELLEEDLENCGELLQAYKRKVGPCPEFEQKSVTSNGADENTDNNVRSELDDIIDGVASNSSPKAKRKNEGVETTDLLVLPTRKK